MAKAGHLAQYPDRDKVWKIDLTKDEAKFLTNLRMKESRKKKKK